LHIGSSPIQRAFLGWPNTGHRSTKKHKRKLLHKQSSARKINCADEPEMYMDLVILQAAIRNVEANIGSLVDCDSTADDINEEIWILAFDAACDAGACQTDAANIAAHVLENLGIHL